MPRRWLIVGILSDRLRVRKPFMVLGGLMAIVFTTMFAIASIHHGTTYGTFRVLMIGIAVSLATAFAPWMAAFTETVERRNPALIAHGLAVWGWIVRMFIAVTIFFVPHVVNTVTPLVENGPAVKAILADPTPVGQTTIGEVATAAAANPAVIAELTTITARDGGVIAALQAHPRIAQALAAAQASGAKPTPAQLGRDQGGTRHGRVQPAGGASDPARPRVFVDDGAEGAGTSELRRALGADAQVAG